MPLNTVGWPVVLSQSKTTKLTIVRAVATAVHVFTFSWNGEGGSGTLIVASDVITSSKQYNSKGTLNLLCWGCAAITRFWFFFELMERRWASERKIFPQCAAKRQFISFFIKLQPLKRPAEGASQAHSLHLKTRADSIGLDSWNLTVYSLTKKINKRIWRSLPA